MSMTAAFDDDFASWPEWARMYRALGIQVVPAHMPYGRPDDWKYPKLAGWKSLQNKLVPQETFERWYGPGGSEASRQNMGIITGNASSNLFVIDLDDQKTKKCGEWWDALIATHRNGVPFETWEQKTGGGGRQILFQAPAGFIVHTGKTPIGVDIRGHGGFAMLPPSLHNSGNTYQWATGHAPWEIPVEQAPQWLLDAIDRLFEEWGATTIRGEHAPRVHTASAEEFNPFGKRIDGREDYMTRLIWACIVSMYRDCPIAPPHEESMQRMRDAFTVYERNVKTRLQAEDNLTGLEAEGRGESLFLEKWNRAMQQWDGKIKSAAGEKKQEQPREQTTPAGNHVSNDEPLGEIDASELPSTIPPRAWLLGNLFCRRYASSIIADGAVGKTSLRYAQLISLAIGRSLTGDHVFQRCRVLIVSLEDDINEVNRRIAALCLHYGIKRADLAGWLFVAAPGHRGGKLLTVDKNGQSVVGSLSGKLLRTIKQRKIDVACLDPFVKTHSVEENNNSMIDEVVQILTDLAIDCNIAIDVPHHTSKGTADPGNANRARGASSMKDAARLVYSLTPMTSEEAQLFNISEAERRFLVRMDSAKVNIAPPMTEARWFKLVSVDLGNGTEMYPAGDRVQAIEPWDPPNMWDKISQNQVDAILAEIDQGLADGNYFSDARSAKERAAWKVVERHIPTLGEAQCRRVIATWMTSNPPQLVRFTYRDPVRRKEVEGVRTVAP